eukprot:5486345-Amphidinium_carterae.1
MNSNKQHHERLPCVPTPPAITPTTAPLQNAFHRSWESHWDVFCCSLFRLFASSFLAQPSPVACDEKNLSLMSLGS